MKCSTLGDFYGQGGGREAVDKYLINLTHIQTSSLTQAGVSNFITKEGAPIIYNGKTVLNILGD